MEKAKNYLVRTYGRRHGKSLSARQKQLVENLLPGLFPRTTDHEPQATILEIGFGAGEHLLALAEQYPERVIIGAEPFINGVAQLLSKMADENGAVRPQYKNIFIFPDDVRRLVSGADFRFSEIYILHPDPWPKARHEKRRLCSAEFLKEISALLSKGGKIVIGTDHADYYGWILTEAARANLIAKTGGVGVIKTRYQEKNMFGSEKTMYLTLFNPPPSEQI
jgi:tRNA (guanine-N7-)-methyltransferase